MLAQRLGLEQRNHVIVGHVQLRLGFDRIRLRHGALQLRIGIGELSREVFGRQILRRSCHRRPRDHQPNRTYENPNRGHSSNPSLP